MWLRGLTSCIFLNGLITSLFFFLLCFLLLCFLSLIIASLNSWFCHKFYDNNIVVSLWQIYLLNFLFHCVMHRMWGEGWNLLGPSAKSITFVGCMVRSLSCLIVMKSFLPLLKLLLETGKYDFFWGLLILGAACYCNVLTW